MIKFTSTRILPPGKKGVIKPDENGYYTTVLGALNSLNSAGAYYPLTKEVRSLFESSSSFMRRISKGVLKAELGHPKMEPGMTDMQYYQRIMDIREKNVCAHISEIWLDEEYGRKHPELNNPNLVAILGKVCPSGPYGYVVKQAFENPKENCCFSIRSLTEDHWEKGRTTKVLKTIITYDFVGEPGLAIATKFHSPALEGYQEPEILKEIDKPISIAALQRLVETSNGIVSMESDNILKEIYETIIEKPKRKPGYADW